MFFTFPDGKKQYFPGNPSLGDDRRRDIRGLRSGRRIPRSTPPRQFLRVVDLAQVQHVPLRYAPAGDPRVLATLQ
jgi:hypothetical protein